MSKTVNSAFSLFLNDTINIPKQISDDAKRSRQFLIDQINGQSNKGCFLEVYNSYNCFFGSFSRKTKICVLDDIDFMIGLNGSGLTIEGYNWDDLSLKITDKNKRKFINLSDSNYYGDYYLNSNKVKNLLISCLNNVPQYDKAEIHGRGEAVTLKLKSYQWNFDIVPAFYCPKTNSSQAFYLIPNGKGKWKKTNPDIERDRIVKLNNTFNNQVYNTVRLVKYWNKRGKMPNITSYVLETLVLDYFSNANHSITNSQGEYDYPDMHFRDALLYISNHISGYVADSKGIQGNINDLDFQSRFKIALRAKSDYEKANNAVKAEIYEKNSEKSIKIWRDIFGEDFPNYE